MIARSHFGLRPRPAQNHSLTAALLVSFAALTLFLFKDLSASKVAPWFGLGSLGVLGAALWIKHRGSWQLNAEVVFLGGISLQYLLAPALLRLWTSDFDTFTLYKQDITVERLEVREGHVGAMVLVMVFAAAFLLGSHFFRASPLRREADGTVQTMLSRGSLVVAVALTAVLWITRIILLKTGSFYHLDRSEFQFDDWRYSVLSTTESILGPLVVAYFYGRALLQPDTLRYPAWLILMLDGVWNFASGSREKALMVVICMGVTFIVAKRRIPLKFILPATLAGVFLIGFMDYYRYAVRHSGSVSELEVGRVMDALHTARDTADAAGMDQTLMTALARLNDLDSIAAIYWWVPEMVDYLKGETYWTIPLALVPRFVWPDKPQMILAINEWFFTHEGGSSPTTTIGEGYLNFGWVGVIMAGLISAFLLRWAERFILKHSDNAIFLPVYISFLLAASRLHTQPAAVWTGTIIKYCLLVWLAHRAAKMLDRMWSSGRTRRMMPAVSPAQVQA